MREVQDGVSTLYWLLTDHLGSQSITANADGSLQSEVRYTAFGETRYSSATATPTDYLYTGQRLEEEVGLYYYGARFYDAELGHFIQADTVTPQPGNLLSYDRYAYANDNPVMYTDPSGHNPFVIIPIIIGLFIIFSQVPGDSVHTDSPGDPNVMLFGLSYMGPGGDALATGIDCLVNGCEPYTTMSTLVIPGPGPSQIDNTLDSLNDSVRLSDEIEDIASQSSYNRITYDNRTIYQNDDLFDIEFIDPESGLTNYELMSQGNAPIGYDGNPVNLHHLLQEEPGPMVEISQSVHQRGSKILHGLVGKGASFRNDKALRYSYKNFRQNYWKWRVEQ